MVFLWGCSHFVNSSSKTIHSNHGPQQPAVMRPETVLLPLNMTLTLINTFFFFNSVKLKKKKVFYFYIYDA